MLALILIAFLGSVPIQASEILKTASLNFNSEVVPEDKEAKLRSIRILAMEEWLRAESPDLVFVQEGWNIGFHASVVQALAKRLGYDYHYRLTMGLKGFLLDSNGILVKSTLKLDERYSIKLPHSAPSLGNGTRWIVSLGSSSWAIGGRVLTSRGEAIYAYSVHLISKSERERGEALVYLHAEIEKEMKARGENPETARILIAGDFNSDPESTTLQQMLQLGYSDTFEVAHPGTRACTECSDPTTPEFNPVTIAPGQFPTQDEFEGNRRIDYILSKGFQPKKEILASTLLFTRPFRGVWMSDHYGVGTTFALGSLPPDLQILNPETDRGEYSAPLSRVIEITDANEGILPLLNISASSGVTFINHTSHRLRINVEGDGEVWPRSLARLKPGRVAAYFFEPGEHRYSFEAHRPFRGTKTSGEFLIDSDKLVR